LNFGLNSILSDMATPTFCCDKYLRKTD
jgi:hypothetical protein